jgi:hypothetical protein
MKDGIKKNTRVHRVVIDNVYFYIPSSQTTGHAVAQLVEALRSKPEVRGFDS